MLEEHQKMMREQMKSVNKLKGEEDGDDVTENDEQNGEKVSEHENDSYSQDEGNEETDAGHEDEYLDEDRHTTVTVEPMKLESEEENDEEGSATSHGEYQRKSHLGESDNATKARQGRKFEQPKAKKRKFHYESKAERKAGRMLQRAKNSKAAKLRRESARK